MKKNTMQMRLDALSQNEAFARVVVGAFFSQLNPTLEELADVKTAVSEAITNSVVHALSLIHISWTRRKSLKWRVGLAHLKHLSALEKIAVRYLCPNIRQLTQFWKK